MTMKDKIINGSLEHVREILAMIRPLHNWEIKYDKPENVNPTDWNRKYLHLVDGEDYFFIFISDKLTYAVNITGDSIITALGELMALLAKKF